MSEEKQKGARFEVSAVNSGDTQDENECYLILDVPHKHLDALIKQLQWCAAFPRESTDENDLWCIYLQGKPVPQVYYGKDGVESGRPPTFLTDEYAQATRLV